MTMHERATVYIPLIAAGRDVQQQATESSDVSSRFVEVYADTYYLNEVSADITEADKAKRQQQAIQERKAIDKYWDRVSAPLRQHGALLYQSGCVAANAIRKIGFQRKASALFQWMQPHAAVESKRLHAASAWAPSEGRSAELGLALALAASICRRQRDIIIVTGALSTLDNEQEAQTRYRAEDCKVHPVSALPQKLRFIQQQIELGAFHDLGTHRQIKLIIPTHYRDQQRTLPTQQLSEISWLEQHGVKVVCVDWLSEALSAIDATTAHLLIYDRLAQAAASILIFFSAIFLILQMWQNAPVTMSFLSVNPDSLTAEPFELCIVDQRQFPQQINKSLLLPTLSSDSIIAWRAKIGNTHSFDARLNALLGFKGYFITLIVVSESSPVMIESIKTEHASHALRVIPGNSYEGWIKLNGQAETNALIILAQRTLEFDANQLRQQFAQRFPASSQLSSAIQTVNLDAAMDFFKSLAPGALVYPFITLQENSKCLL